MKKGPTTMNKNNNDDIFGLDLLGTSSSTTTETSKMTFDQLMGISPPTNNTSTTNNDLI